MVRSACLFTARVRGLAKRTRTPKAAWAQLPFCTWPGHRHAPHGHARQAKDRWNLQRARACLRAEEHPLESRQHPPGERAKGGCFTRRWGKSGSPGAQEVEKQARPLRLLLSLVLQAQPCPWPLLRRGDGHQVPAVPSRPLHSQEAAFGPCASAKIPDFIANTGNCCSLSQRGSESRGCWLSLGFGVGLGWNRHCLLIKNDLILRKKEREKREREGSRFFFPLCPKAAPDCTPAV